MQVRVVLGEIKTTNVKRHGKIRVANTTFRCHFILHLRGHEDHEAGASLACEITGEIYADSWFSASTAIK
jgi:hypothetical protein